MEGKKKSKVLHKIKVVLRNIAKLIVKGIDTLIDKFKNSKMFKYYFLTVVAIIVIIFGVIFLVGSSDQVVKKYSKGWVNGNADKMYSTVNDKYVDAVESSSNIIVKEYFKESLTTLEANDSDYVSYDIVDSYKLEDPELEEVLSDIAIYAPSFDTNKIKAVKRYLIKYKIKTSEGYYYSYISVYAMKVGFSWSIVYNV